MADSPEQKFLLRFNGNIWNIVADDHTLLIEVRNPEQKVVSFSAFDIDGNEFLWRDKVLEEPWWVNASAVAGDKIIFTVYLDTNNPDKKGVLAYSRKDLSLIWWNNDFSLSELGTDSVLGFSSRLGLKELILDINTGNPVTNVPHTRVAPSSLLERPAQYAEGTEYFETVRRFLADRLNFSAVFALEYLEARNSIVISAYCKDQDNLANYLFILSAEGKVLLKENLGSQLPGIGLDTFFVLKGCVIFVRNKLELLSYKML